MKHHHLIESYILATKFEERYIVEDRYNRGEHCGYQINIKSQILDGNFINITKSQTIEDQYHISFRAYNTYMPSIKKALGLKYYDYSMQMYTGQSHLQTIVIKGDAKFIYSKLKIMDQALEEVTKFFQSTFAC